DVRNVRVHHQLNLVLEPEFAALQSCQLKLVCRAADGKKLDLLVEPPMFGFKRLQLSGRMIIVHRGASLPQLLRRWNSVVARTTRAPESRGREFNQDNLWDSWFITHR